MVGLAVNVLLGLRRCYRGLHRMWSGIVAPATAELEQDVREFFHSRKIDMGRKTLELYLEQLRIAVTLRNRERRSLRELLHS